MALEREDLHTHCADSCSNRATDVAVSDDADGLAGNGQHVKRLPEASDLAANHAAEILGEIEDGAECKLSERGAEHAAPVGHGDVACDELGEKRALQAG